jgi:Rieske Fe-S protein
MMSTPFAPLPRRRFCTMACRAVSGATLATLLPACAGGSSSPTSPAPAGGGVTTLAVVAGAFGDGVVRVTAAGSALAEVGGAALVPSTAGEFLVARTGASSVVVIDAICSHESCTVTGAAGAVYVCPCHGSRYDRNGQVLAGPAPAALRRFDATVADGVVTIAL